MDGKTKDLVDWWINTVFLAFFPIIISIIMSILIHSSVDFNRMIGDGELILSSFLVSTPSLINLYKGRNENKLIFYLLLFASFFQLIAYTTIKTNLNNSSTIVYITSFICVITSIIISLKSELHLQGGRT